MSEARIFWPRFEKVIFHYLTQPEVEGVAKLATQRYQASAEKQYQTRMDSLISNLLDHESQESKFYTLLGNEKALAIFNDSCEEILQSSSSANLATVVRHRGVKVVFTKHNLYQQGKYCVTVDKNKTHLLILKSPRMGRQLRLLGLELEFADPTFLQDVYQSATSVPHGRTFDD